MKSSPRRALVGAAGLVLLAAMAALVLHPYTNPWIIHIKTHVVGSGLTYGPLASDDAKWETVLNGVRSGDSRWLRVAADLQPALDTHPGEEMAGALVNVLDKNPTGALQVLLPGYGAEVVCGEDEGGAAIDPIHAGRRAQLLRTQPESPERRACLTVVMRVIRSGRAE